MSKAFGYCRVSTTDQDLAIQLEALRKNGVNDALIFREQVSGTSRDGRRELARVLALLGSGDTLAVTRLDRLGRSMRDLANIAHEIEQAGAHLRVIEQGVDTSTAAGRAFYGMLSVFAQFETDIRRERQMEGVAKAKAAGLYKGRKPTVDRAKVRAMKAEGRRPCEIAKALRISKMSVWRALNESTTTIIA